MVAENVTATAVDQRGPHEAAGNVLGCVAQSLCEIRKLAAGAISADDEAECVAMLAGIEAMAASAGSLADRAASALAGAPPIQDADWWLYDDRSRAAIESLERTESAEGEAA